LWFREGFVAGNENTIAALKAASGPTRWQKGQSGNPAGRVPKDRVLQTYVATKTHDGRKMVDELWSIALDAKIRVRDRIKAMEILLERGFGKPVQQVEVDGQVNLTRELSSFSDKELMELVDLRKRLRGDEEDTAEEAQVIEGEARVV